MEMYKRRVTFKYTGPSNTIQDAENAGQALDEEMDWILKRGESEEVLLFDISISED